METPGSIFCLSFTWEAHGGVTKLLRENRGTHELSNVLYGRATRPWIPLVPPANPTEGSQSRVKLKELSESVFRFWCGSSRCVGPSNLIAKREMPSMRWHEKEGQWLHGAEMRHFMPVKKHTGSGKVGFNNQTPGSFKENTSRKAQRPHLFFPCLLGEASSFDRTSCLNSPYAGNGVLRRRLGGSGYHWTHSFSQAGWFFPQRCCNPPVKGNRREISHFGDDKPN